MSATRGAGQTSAAKSTDDSIHDATYLDSCVLLSLFLGDSGYEATECWLLNQGETTL